jgi:uncharacterized membrane protein
MEDIFITLFLFGSIFGIFYLHYTTRNRERMALIEKGADASIFFTKKEKRRTTPFWKILLLNFALLLMGVGFGYVIGELVGQFSIIRIEKSIPGFVFIFAGMGLLIGYFISRNFDKQK